MNQELVVITTTRDRLQAVRDDLERACISGDRGRLISRFLDDVADAKLLAPKDDAVVVSGAVSEVSGVPDALRQIEKFCEPTSRRGPGW